MGLYYADEIMVTKKTVEMTKYFLKQTVTFQCIIAISDLYHSISVLGFIFSDILEFVSDYYCYTSWSYMVYILLTIVQFSGAKCRFLQSKSDWWKQWIITSRTFCYKLWEVLFYIALWRHVYSWGISIECIWREPTKVKKTK